MKLKPVTSPEDVKLVAGLADACWRVHYTSILGMEQVDYMLERFQSEAAISEQITDGRQYSLILDSKQFAVGYLAIDLKPDHLFLSKIYIHPDYQGRGVGRWVIAELIRLQQTLDIRLTVNKQNHSAITFYERNGFTNEGPLVTEIGESYVMDDWMMVKKRLDSLKS